MNSWQKANIIGTKAELIVTSYLEYMYDYKITDVTKDRKYQAIDVDFIIENGKDGKVLLEVKSQITIYDKQSLYFEDTLERKRGTKQGWFNKCQADVVAFWCDKNRMMYCIDFKKARPYITENGQHIRFLDKYDNCYVNGITITLTQARENGLILLETGLDYSVRNRKLQQ